MRDSFVRWTGTLKPLFRWRLPDSKVAIFMVICGVAFILSVFVLTFLFSYSPATHNLPDPETWAVWLLRIVRYVSITCFFGAMVIFGIRNLRSSAFSKGKIVIPILGIACCLFFAFTEWNLSMVFGSLEGTLEIKDEVLRKAEERLYQIL